MKPRYYVVFIQHNKEVNAENRTVPSGFDDLKSAQQKYYEQLGKDMKNATLDWSVGFILDSYGNICESRYWTDIVEEPEPEPAEEPTE